MFQETFNSFLSKEYSLETFSTRFRNAGIDQEIWGHLTDLGLYTILIPEEYGGIGLGFVDLALVLEELGNALVPPPVVETVACTDLIVRYGSDQQKELLLPSIAAGKLSIVPALQEQDSGFNPNDIATEMTKSGRGWSLRGGKILVPQAASADFIIIVARESQSGKLVTALLDRKRAGISLREHSTLDLSCRLYELTLNDVAIEDSDLLGDVASGQSAARLFDVFSMVSALQMIGIARKVLDISVVYATQRIQFDKPIGSFQAIKHKCADMAVAIDSGQSAAYFAAWAVAEDSSERSRAVSIAKSFCGDTAGFVCREGIQIHGGMGFTWELGLHYYLRRTKVLQYSFGDASFHRERVITDTLAGLQNRY